MSERLDWFLFVCIYRQATTQLYEIDRFYRCSAVILIKNGAVAMIASKDESRPPQPISLRSQ